MIVETKSLKKVAGIRLTLNEISYNSFLTSPYCKHGNKMMVYLTVPGLEHAMKTWLAFLILILHFSGNHTNFLSVLFSACVCEQASAFCALQFPKQALF